MIIAKNENSRMPQLVPRREPREISSTIQSHNDMYNMVIGYSSAENGSAKLILYVLYKRYNNRRCSYKHMYALL